MIHVLLLAAAFQAAPAPAPAAAAAPGPAAQGPAAVAEKPVDATASVKAYVDWRMCIDGIIGHPPRARKPKRAAIEAALETCRSHEDALRIATAEAWGAESGAKLFKNMTDGARADIGLTPER